MQFRPARRSYWLGLALALAACQDNGPLPNTSGATPSALKTKINHVIVIYQENRSFDSLYGLFPGANGIANAGAALKQVDKDGKLLTALPRPLDPKNQPDTRFPESMPVAPFDAAKFVPNNERTGDLIHRYYHEPLQINGGKMDKFVTWSDNGGLVMSYYDATNMPQGKIAQQYTLADNFFHSAFGGSFLNHQWLICACTPVWPDAPADMLSIADPKNLKDGAVTPDGYAVNTVFTVNMPHPASITDPKRLLPNQTLPTIGDRLSAAGISWAWYSGAWNDALAGKEDKALFQYHHQAFAFFANYSDGKPAKAVHLKDEQEFLAALKGDQLPAVSFIKPFGPDNEHPGYAALAQGQQHVADLVSAVQQSSYWKDSAIIITYDENGGLWDHVAPPVIDKWGPGSRVPAIIVSPYAKRHYVDHTQYETVSILKFIESRWDLAPLGTRDAAANNLLNAFDFNQPGP